MEKSISLKRKQLFINQRNNRIILKLFGEMDHNYITIEKDKILTISKMRADNFEKKGQITKWQFNLDQIYTQDTTFDELYENEIENTDYLHEFNEKPQYNTLIFVGDKNDSLTDSPYREFIIKSVKECMNDLAKIENESDNSTLLPYISFCELNQSCVVDYLKEKDTNKDINTIKRNTILKHKLKIYEDDIIKEDLSLIKITNGNEFIPLLNLAKKNFDFIKINKWKTMQKDKSLTQIITLKLLKSDTNECYSKINFVLYKAYEILEKNDLSKNFISGYNLYTKDNYNFFKGVQNKINYRLSYVIKYLKDTLSKGNNLFIVLLPCEYQYMSLLHDLLNNIKMRKLIVENILLNGEEEEESTNQLGEIYKFENISELNFGNKDIIGGNSFQSFSKNNSIITNVSSAFDGKWKICLNNSYYENKLTEGKNKRKEINYERLRKIKDKNNIINLFDMLDKLPLHDWKLSE